MVYVDDDLFTRLSHVAIWNTRQTEFGKEMPYAGRPAYGGTIVGPPADTTWLRITHRVDPRNGEHELRGLDQPRRQHLGPRRRVDAARRGATCGRPGVARRATHRPGGHRAVRLVPHRTADPQLPRRHRTSPHHRAGGTTHDPSGQHQLLPPPLPGARRRRGGGGRPHRVRRRQVSRRGRRGHRERQQVHRQVHRARGHAGLLERLHRRRRPVHGRAGQAVPDREPEDHGEAEHHPVGRLLPEGPGRGDRREGPGRRRHAPGPAGHERRAQGDRAGRRRRRRPGPGGVRLQPGELEGRHLPGQALRHPARRALAGHVLAQGRRREGGRDRGADGRRVLRGGAQGLPGGRQRPAVLDALASGRAT